MFSSERCRGKSGLCGEAGSPCPAATVRLTGRFQQIRPTSPPLALTAHGGCAFPDAFTATPPPGGSLATRSLPATARQPTTRVCPTCYLSLPGASSPPTPIFSSINHDLLVLPSSGAHQEQLQPSLKHPTTQEDHQHHPPIMQIFVKTCKSPSPHHPPRSPERPASQDDATPFAITTDTNLRAPQ